MNLPAAGWLSLRRHRTLARPGANRSLGYRARTFSQQVRSVYLNRPGLVVLSVGALITATAALLELVNFANGWLLFEDVACAAAPAGAAAAVGWSAYRSGPAHRTFRTLLAASLTATAIGQLIADIPDVTRTPMAITTYVANSFHVVGAVTGIVALIVTLLRRVPLGSRRAVLIDGLVIMAAAVTFAITNWLRTNGGTGHLWSDPILNLVLPVVSAIFFATATAAVVATLALRMEPALRSAWSIIIGMTLIAIAWQGWIGRFVAGTPDGIEPMDFIMPAGALLAGLGGVTWSYRQGGGVLYDRIASGVMEWLPIVAVVGCAVLDLMPRARPFDVDPIAVGTFGVVLLAMARQRMIMGRERVTSERLTTEMSDRAATTVSLARLEAGATIEETAERICAEALHLGGIDTVGIFAFTSDSVVTLAQGGPPSRPVTVGEPLPQAAAEQLREHAEFGLWLESWADREPRDDFDRAIYESGLRAEALAPLIWNDEPVGLIAMGATTPAHARRLADRLPTVTEFSVMSAAVLGPALAEKAQRDRTRSEIQAIIETRAFDVVYQPIVELATGIHVGYESLARFHDGTRPDLCFLAADRVGMMVALETAVLRRQVAEARRLPQGSFLSLNVSPALAMALIPLLDVLSEADRPVVLEVTEHLEIDDYPRLMNALDRVRGHAMLAVDDAGAGYAGLRHILELRPHYVKLDISLVRNVDTDPARQAMVTGMAYFAASAGCSLIAEGIETANEMTALRLLDVKYGQGYFLARPGPAQ